MITKYNPDIHHRKSIRLKSYDYSSNGAYFITICTQDREYYFKEFPILAEIVKKQWEKLEERFDNLILDEFIIMPNHIHGILFLGGGEIGGQPNPSNSFRGGQPQGIAPTNAPTNTSTNISMNTSNKKPTLGDILGAFKSLCIKEWLKYIKNNNINALGKFWHRNYYEKIIRDEVALNNIRKYIRENPSKWENDELRQKVSDE